MKVDRFQFLFIYFIFSVVTAQTQHDEDAVCRKKNTKSRVWTCKKLADCEFKATLAGNVSRCGSNESPEEKICCPRRRKPAEVVWEKCLQYVNETSYETVFEESPVLFEPGRNVTRPVCQITETQIFGGEPADRDEYPHMALIGYPTKSGVIQWLCGGSLISERFILSAAHCSHSRGTKAQWVLLGELKRPHPQSKDVRPGQFEIETAFPHPDYKQPYEDNDIILFKLRKTITFGKSMRPICLHTHNWIPKDQEQKLIITGWGITGPDRDYSDVLIEAGISRAPDSSCETHYQNHNGLRSGYNPRTMICAGDLKNDTCDGDSGGPLQFELMEYRCMYFQVGITSIGPAFCGNKNNHAPAIYTNVAHYISWIQRIVWP